jgi:hypothetical protein
MAIKKNRTNIAYKRHNASLNCRGSVTYSKSFLHSIKTLYADVNVDVYTKRGEKKPPRHPLLHLEIIIMKRKK